MTRPGRPRWEAIAAATIAAGFLVAWVALGLRQTRYERDEHHRATGYLDTLATGLTTELAAWHEGMLADGRWTASLIASVEPRALPMAASDLVRGQMPTARLWLVDPTDRVIGDPGAGLTPEHLALVRSSRAANTTVLGASEVHGAQLRLALATPVPSNGGHLIAVLDLAATGRLARRIPRVEWRGAPGRVVLTFPLGRGFVAAEWPRGIGEPAVRQSATRPTIAAESFLVVGGGLPDSTPSFELAIDRSTIAAPAAARVRRERTTTAMTALGLGLIVAVMGWRGRNRQLDAAVRQAADLRLRAAEAEGAVARAGLAALQARMHPHFLSNALHSLSALIGQDPQAAEEAIDRLGDLFRYALEQSELALVPLGDEWRFATDYLAIEALRLGERLRVELTWDPGVADTPVPPFSIQVLVENAIRHGIAPARRGGTVRLSARRVDRDVWIEVADDGVGARPEAIEAGAGTGLKTLRERLALDPDRPGRLEIDTSPGAGCRVRFVTLANDQALPEADRRLDTPGAPFAEPVPSIPTQPPAGPSSSSLAPSTDIGASSNG
jgi:hypothetical protein